MNAYKLGMVTLLLATQLMGCDYDRGTVAYPGTLTLQGTVTKSGEPYARKSIYVTFTGYYPKAGNSQTFNGAAETDEQGRFSIDTTAILCSARRDLKTTTTSSGVTDTAYFITDPGATGSMSVTTTTSFIPRSICSGFELGDADSLKELGFVLDLSPESTETDDSIAARLADGVNAEIIPIQIGIIANDLRESTLGKISAAAFDMDHPDSLYIQRKSLSEYSKTLNRYPLYVTAEFDLSNSNKAAPGKLANPKAP